MTESIPNPESQSLFNANILSAQELSRSKEYAPVMNWFTEQCKHVPEMNISTTHIKEAGEIKNNPAFFSHANVDVTVAGKKWNQGAIIQRGERLKTSDQTETDVHGAAILLIDPDGNTFITVSQEPLAHAKYRTNTGMLRDTHAPGTTEIHPVVRTPLQTSMEKLSRIMKSESKAKDADPVMATILSHIAKERRQSVKTLLENIPLSQAETDGNRMSSNILYGALRMSQKEAQDIHTLIPQGRWVTPKELDALTAAGYTNATISIARNISQAQKTVGLV